MNDRQSARPRRAAVGRAAAELADENGLAGVTVARVAARLGLTTTLLHGYVPTRTDLLLLAEDAAHGDPPAATPDDWRTGLATWTRAVLADHRRHPWRLDLPYAGAGPAHLAWMEAGLQNLARLDLTESERLTVIRLLHGHARAEARLHHATGPAYGQVIRTHAGPGTHPALSRLAAAGVFDTGADPTDFDFALTTILDGLQPRAPHRAARG